MPGPKKLFGLSNNVFVFGVDKNSHVAHIIDLNDDDDFVGVCDPDREPETSGYGTVGMQELYTNKGEANTKDFFIKMATKAAKDYEDITLDQDMKNVLLCVKDYLTAKSRDGQQGALMTMQVKMLAYHDKLVKESAKLAGAKKDENLEKQRRLNWYAAEFAKQLYGNLQVPKEEDAQLGGPKDIKEPKDVFIGKVGIWQESAKSLFPHDPSPNDVKQGVGVQDCYVLSTLSRVAATHPEEIKNMMRDNGDGTVSVRFFGESEEGGKVPVYIKVNKTVNQTIFGHNMYASSSLWVQMIEKAYAVFEQEYGTAKDGMNNIWRGSSQRFMNAISEKPYDVSMGIISSYSGVYNRDDSGKMVNHPDYYLDEEKQTFDLLDRYVNKAGEPVVVGSTLKADGYGITDPKNYGIRTGHAYAVNKVFEKDGKYFVQVRDPYASFQAQYNNDGTLNDNWVKHDLKAAGATVIAGNSTMGTFNLELKDFMGIFNSYTCVPKEMEQERKELSANARNYSKNPLSPEELIDEKKYRFVMDHREPVEEEVLDAPAEEEIEMHPVENEDGFEIEGGMVGVKKEVPEEEDFSGIEISYDGSQQLGKMLNNRKVLDQFSDRVSKALKDIQATDEWFVWTNTKQFKDMKKGLETLNKNLKAAQKDPDFCKNPDKIRNMTQQIMDVRDKADEYIESKNAQIAKNYAKGKEPSLRAIHRLTGAVNIRNIMSFEEPLTAWPGKDKEAMGIVKNDIEARIKMFENGERIPHDDKTLEQTQKALSQIKTLVEKNPSLRTEAEKAQEIAEKAGMNMLGDDF